jgi:hypothetical protein
MVIIIIKLFHAVKGFRAAFEFYFKLFELLLCWAEDVLSGCVRVEALEQKLKADSIYFSMMTFVNVGERLFKGIGSFQKFFCELTIHGSPPHRASRFVHHSLGFEKKARLPQAGLLDP